MAQSSLESSSLWSWALPILHTEPHVWTVVQDFHPRLTSLGLHPTLEWSLALLWAALDAAYIPVLLSLGPIIEPLLNYNKEDRDRLRDGVYLWTFTVFLYKVRWAWHSFSCEDMTWIGNEYSARSGPLMSRNEFICATAIVPELGMAFGALAVLASYRVWRLATDGRDSGPLYNIAMLCLSVAAASVCLYPLVDVAAGTS